MCNAEKIGEVGVQLDPGEMESEGAFFDVEVFDNGDHDVDGIYTVGTVTLNSYGNIATITVGNVTPKVLRELADKLEAKIAVVVKSFGG